VTADSDVIDPKADEIAAAKLAVDGEVEHRQIAFAVLDLKSDTNGPDLFRPKRALLANETALVPRRSRMIAFSIEFRWTWLTSTPDRSHRALVLRAVHRIATGPSRGAKPADPGSTSHGA
jgi:hypothetical protein